MCLSLLLFFSFFLPFFPLFSDLLFFLLHSCGRAGGLCISLFACFSSGQVGGLSCVFLFLMCSSCLNCRFFSAHLSSESFLFFPALVLFSTSLDVQCIFWLFTAMVFLFFPIAFSSASRCRFFLFLHPSFSSYSILSVTFLFTLPILHYSLSSNIHSYDEFWHSSGVPGQPPLLPGGLPRHRVVSVTGLVRSVSSAQNAV